MATLIDQTTRNCRACGQDKPETDWLPSHWRGHGRKCAECFRAHTLTLARARGVQPRKVGTWTPERKAAAQKAWHEKNPTARRRLDLKKYNLTLDEYEQMLLDQGGVCAACKRPETRVVRGTVCSLHVDHDHETGEVRGLLCTRCNFALGYAQDNPVTLLALADYLLLGGK